MTVKFDRQTLLDILYGGSEDGVVVRDRQSGSGRWSIHHDLVFMYKDKLYETSYSVGATERQDESPWEYEDQVECVEVEEYQKTATDYRPVAA